MTGRNRLFPLAVTRALAWLLAALLLACGFFAASILGCGLLFSGPNSLFHSHPSDEQLIQVYGQQKNELNRLVEMFQDESNNLTVVFSRGNGQCRVVGDYELVRATDHSKCQEAARLLKTLGFQRVDGGQGWLMVTASASGLSVSGSSKGYVYSTTPPGHIVDDTDTYQPYNEIVFRHIEDNWHIFYESS